MIISQKILGKILKAPFKFDFIRAILEDFDFFNSVCFQVLGEGFEVRGIEFFRQFNCLSDIIEIESGAEIVEGHECGLKGSMGIFF